MLLALTRAVPRSIDRCELTHLERVPIDYARAVEEHDRYEAALREAGCRVQRLPDAPDLPDSVFVEDTAVVFDELAVIARPGAASRRAEVAATVCALRPHRRLAFIHAPGTLDGGDVLVTNSSGGRSRGTVFVGDTPRTNAEGARQLAAFVAPLGYDVVRVSVTQCLHLKSAVTSLRGSAASAEQAPLLLINRDWIDPVPFDGFDLMDVDPAEPAAANVLAVGETVLCASEYPRTRDRLAARGFVTRSIPAGELAKAEGGLTCGSLLIAPFNIRPN